MTKNFVLLPFFFALFVCAPVSAGSGCERSGSVEYKGIRKMAAWGREASFAAFEFSNKTDGVLRLPLDNASDPIIVHGRSIEVQSRPIADSMAWGLDATVLEEYVQPRKWLIMEPGEAATFFVDMTGAVGDRERSRTREYRIVLESVSDCAYSSPSFLIAD